MSPYQGSNPTNPYLRMVRGFATATALQLDVERNVIPYSTKLLLLQTIWRTFANFTMLRTPNMPRKPVNDW